MPETAARSTVDQFTYRKIVVMRSAEGSRLPRWIAEIRRGRTYEFIRAEAADEMRRKIDEALARSPRW